MQTAPMVGQSYDLLVQWGGTRRHQCCRCRCFLPDIDRVACRCGALYRRVRESTFILESVAA